MRIDVHTHVLPGIDDGSKSVEESLRMLSMMREQGIDLVCATPHFYAHHSAPEVFFERRARALEKLEDSPVKILAGAEVLYFQGVSRIPEIHDFCIEGTDVLLLEMPTVRWTDGMMQELRQLTQESGIDLVIAHAERYLPFEPKNRMEELFELGAAIQCNADFFLSWRTYLPARRWLKRGRVHLLGSDSHGTQERVPNLSKGYEAIEKLAGPGYVREIEENAERLICG